MQLFRQSPWLPTPGRELQKAQYKPNLRRKKEVFDIGKEKGRLYHKLSVHQVTRQTEFDRLDDLTLFVVKIGAFRLMFVSILKAISFYADHTGHVESLCVKKGHQGAS
jgi:hypothetical protein